MSGNRVDVGTLNLNPDFTVLREQLNEIAEKFFLAQKNDIRKS